MRILYPERLRTLPAGPVVVYLNHPSWWDPIVCAELSRRLMPGRNHRAPISAASLKQYRFFRHIGMFPVEQDSPRGAVQFLRTAAVVLQGGGVLWITAQGHFTDARVRPVALKSGLGALLQRSDSLTVVPLALEYTFWNQRLPEVLLAVGEPFFVDRSRDLSVAEWTGALETQLHVAQDHLAAASLARDPDAFTMLLEGRRGTAGPYALWQRLRARLFGQAYSADLQDRVVRGRGQAPSTGSVESVR